MDLAARFLERAGEAVDRLDEANIIAVRNALIRAHKELVAHRAMCVPIAMKLSLNSLGTTCCE